MPFTIRLSSGPFHFVRYLNIVGIQHFSILDRLRWGGFLSHAAHVIRCEQVTFTINFNIRIELANLPASSVLRPSQAFVTQTCSFSKLPRLTIDMQPAGCMSDTCSSPAAYYARMMPMDDVFRALADPSRRALLDSLNEQNGQSLRELCARLSMTRQSVSKHLAVLEAAHLRAHPAAGEREAAFPRRRADQGDRRRLDQAVRACAGATVIPVVGLARRADSSVGQ